MGGSVFNIERGQVEGADIAGRKWISPLATTRRSRWRWTARFFGAWIDGSQASPDPDWLAYRVVIYSDGTASTVVRQVDVGQGEYQARQVYTYDSTQQIADFGSVQSVVYAQVLQVGRTDVSRPAAA